MEIHVLQGEREFAKDNRTLGKFLLDGIPPAPRGVPQVEVTFDIDANGILNVQAPSTRGPERSSRSASSRPRVSPRKRSRPHAPSEAEAHAEEDKERRELVDLKNQVEHRSSTRPNKQLGEHKRQAAADEDKTVHRGRRRGCAGQKTAENGDKADDRGRAPGPSQQKAQKLGEVVYQQQAQQDAGAPPEPPPSADGGSNDDEPVDADFEVKA